MIPTEKPGSPEEVLEHHGIKGQKWGIRRNLSGSGGTPSSIQKRVTKSKAYKVASKATQANVQAHYARKRARKERNETAAKKAWEVAAPRVPKGTQKGIALTRSSREFRAQNPTGKLQAKAILEARKGANLRAKAIRKEKDSVERARLMRDHMNHPGTPIALRSTRGEKVVDIILLGGVRSRGIGGDLAAISTGATLGTVAERRSIERKQRKGKYT